METTELPIGTVIENEYRIEGVIGKGAFGVVYSCRELSLQGSRTVALKMLSAARDGKEMERFLAEGRILASLNHQNVVRIYRLGFHESTPFIVMEMVEGRTLRDLMDGPPLALKRALRIMAQVASGLSAIHAKGIVHRDLSAKNVMVAGDGTAKILDLGLAKDMRALATLSREGYLVGTVAYISPEQIEGRPATPASDVFSLGILLYEIITGQHPFAAEHYMSVMYNIANKDFIPLEQTLKDPPPPLVALIGQCLAKDPEERPAHAGPVERALGEMAKAENLETTRTVISDGPPSTREATPKNPYLNRAMIRRWRDFFGRSQEIRRIYARLNATPPGSVSIVGDRKIGKSSLLNYIYLRQNRESFLERPDQMVMIFLDLQEEKNMSIESFVRILIRMSEYELRGRLELGDYPHSLDGVKSLVEKLHEADFRMAILLDEFDAVTANPNFDLEFFAFLRYLANHYNVAYITSSMRDLQTLCHTEEISDSPFFNIFSTLRLSVFRPEEAEELIRVPSERAGRPLATYRDRFLDMAGLFPFYLQIACSHALDYLDENASAREPDFDEVYRRFYKEVRLHYRYLWSNLDDHERSAICRVATGKKIPDDLRHVLNELEGRHLVRLGAKVTDLFARSFQQFVTEEGLTAKIPLWKRIPGFKGSSES